METKKKYLSFPKKIAYGTGDLGSNFFYMMITSFALIYMTDAVGLDPGIVGTLIMISKLLDGITDVFFGGLIDKTHSKMGKARPWMFFSGFPLAICLVLIFAIPSGMASVGQYIWFFLFYTCANALCYTANNIAYATMSALITKNDAERVSLGTFRYVFAVLASVLIMSVTVGAVNALGGGMEGWRSVAIIYAVLFLIFNSLASLICKEVVEDGEADRKGKAGEPQEQESFWVLLKCVFTNKFYILLVAIYLLLYINTGLAGSIGVYYFTYILGDASLLGVVSMVSFIMIIGLMLNPALVKRFGMYRVNLVSYILTSVMAFLLIIFAYAANFTGIVAVSFLKCVTMAFLMGSLNAVVAEVARNNWLKNKVHTEGMMFSCSSIGMKVGGGLGAAVSGWILSLAGYVGSAAEQTPDVMHAIKFTYAGIPFILTVLITICLYFMKVSKENESLAKKGEVK